jgi:hypothetical protein
MTTQTTSTKVAVFYGGGHSAANWVEAGGPMLTLTEGKC